MDLTTTIKQVQQALGFVGNDVDGKAGPKTWTAILAKVSGKAQAVAAQEPVSGLVDERSEKVIATLLPHVRPYARALVNKAKAAGITIKVISGTRSEAEQNALYAKGRTTEGPKVTNARFGYSNHNFGIAFDIGIFEGAKYIPESSAYKAVGSIGMDIGLDWGGSWKSIVDEPHFQLRSSWAAGMNESKMLAELRGGRKAA